MHPRTSFVFFQSTNQTGAENPDDTSAASIRSSSGAPVRKKGSRMVMVDYSNKNGGPQPIRDPNAEADNQGLYSIFLSAVVICV